MVHICKAGVGAAGGVPPPSINAPRPTLRACLWLLGVGRPYTRSSVATDVPAHEDTTEVGTPAPFSRMAAVLSMGCVPSLGKSKSSNGCGLPSMRVDAMHCPRWPAAVHSRCNHARSDTAMLLVPPFGVKAWEHWDGPLEGMPYRRPRAAPTRSTQRCLHGPSPNLLCIGCVPGNGPRCRL